MKIEQIEVINLPLPIPEERRFAFAGGVATGRLTSNVRVTVTGGLTGIGTAYIRPELVRVIG